MPLESTMICLDNSEWMRNGDYNPTRLESQQDAAGLICNDRTQGNPENTVGVLSMAGQGVDLLVSPTEDAGKVLASFSKVRIGGKSDFASSVQIAHLALKHRKNKNGASRIIVFVGSPLSEDVATLQKIGKNLKKNNVAVDIISMGELEDNSEKLLEFVKAVNSGDNSHLISVPPGVIPGDAISSSPVLHRSTAFGQGVIGGDTGGGGGGNFEEYGGVDPSLDPEMAMALRISAETARAEAEAKTQEAIEASRSQTGAGGPDAAAGGGGGGVGGAFGGPGAVDEDDEEMLMQRALELSMMSFGNESGGGGGSGSSSAEGTSASSLSEAPASAAGVAASMNVDSAAPDEEDEEEMALRLALEMSLGGGAAAASAGGAATSAAAAAPADDSMAFLDPAFVSQLLGSVDVDISDPLIQSALAQMGAAGAAKPADGSDPGGSAGGGDGSGEGDKGSKKRKGDEA